MNKKLLSNTLTVVLLGSTTYLSADDGINILSDIKIKGELRPRYEIAAVSDNTLEKAQAFTNRTHLVISSKLLNVDNLDSNNRFTKC
ncbi:MAG: hypothetical protein Q9M40_02890 [Sulfurimonas sp.]|nr:hypothetical protein [Sulfurimonas sp.]